MMKSLLRVLLIFFACFYYAQYTVVGYTYKSPGSESFYNAFLLYNASESYYIIPAHKVYKNYTELEEDADFLKSQRYRTSFYRENLASSTIYGFDWTNSQYNLYKDDVEDFNWVIGKETQTILNYNCTLATGHFRGRKYKVWFTTDIPVSTGPWKVSGLPGLVLKVTVDEGAFSYEAFSITFNKKDTILLDHKYRELYEKNKSRAISFKSFVELDNKFMLDIVQKHLANLPAGAKIYDMPPIRSAILEKSFEWENE